MENTTHTEETHVSEGHAHNDNAVIMGREFPFPIYTAVFIGLGILTLIEITLSQAPRGGLTIPIMLILALTKAGLVVWFYMHLNKDSRIFAAALLIPFFLVIVCTLFLMIIPVGY
jgi:caa(3)-type oxidase subunit IV